MRLLLLCVTLFISPVWASSAADAHRVFQKLKAANGIYFNSPQLYIDGGSARDAFSNGRNVHISQGMLRYLRNDAELAMILGHELAHLRVGGRTSHEAEYNADAKGAQYIARAGYSICKGAQAIKRFYDGDSRSHPASAKRVRALGC